MLKEILQSYRLIFGQDGRAYKCFRRSELAKDMDKWNTDPLLRRLCENDCKGEPVYQRILDSPVQSSYSAREDFPFFGKRLLGVQEFIIRRNPSDLLTLYYDRRDPLRFYTLWIVVFVGGVSILLSLLQLGLVTAQVVQEFSGSSS